MKEGLLPPESPKVFNEAKMLRGLSGMWGKDHIKSIDDIGKTYIKEVHLLAEKLTKAYHDEKAIAPNLGVVEILNWAMNYLSKESEKDGITDTQKQAILKERQIIEALSDGLFYGQADTEWLWKNHIPPLKKRK